MPLQRAPWDSGVSNLAKGRGGGHKDKGSSKYKWQRARSSREGRKWTAFFLGWWFCRLRSVRRIKLSLVLDVTQMYYTYVYSFTWICFPPGKTLYALISWNAVMGWGGVLLSPLQNWENWRQKWSHSKVISWLHVSVLSRTGNTFQLGGIGWYPSMDEVLVVQAFSSEGLCSNPSSAASSVWAWVSSSSE